MASEPSRLKPRTSSSKISANDSEIICGAKALSLRESLPEIVDKRLGGVCVVDQDGRLAGLVVDGDVKRVLLENDNALDLSITKAMNDRPTTIDPGMLAIDALRMMEQRQRGPVTLLIAVDKDQRPVGLLHIHDVLRAGLL